MKFKRDLVDVVKQIGDKFGVELDDNECQGMLMQALNSSGPAGTPPNATGANPIQTEVNERWSKYVESVDPK